MSTKIYNAYQVNVSTVPELHAFTQTLKQLCSRQLIQQTKEMAATRAAHIFDLAALSAKAPDLLSILYKDFDAQIDAWCEEAMHNRVYILNTHLNPDKLQDKVKTRNIYSLKNLAMNIVLNRAAKTEITHHFGHDLYNSVVFFTDPETRKTYLIAYGRTLERILETASNPNTCCEALKPYKIQDFHYQDQTDQPEDISDEEWSARKETWDRLMPNFVPAQDGTQAVLTNYDNLCIPIEMQIIQEDLTAYAPERSHRIQNLAKHITESIAVSENHDLFKVSREIANKSGEHYDKYLDIKSQLENVLLPFTNTHPELGRVTTLTVPDIITKLKGE